MQLKTMQGDCICLSTNCIFKFVSSHHTLLQLNIALRQFLMLLLSESLCILSYAKFDTYDLFISKLILLVLLICHISIFIHSYYIICYTLKWLLMKLWQKPSRLFMCILNCCSMKTLLLHNVSVGLQASVGLHQTTIRPSDLYVHTKWTKWIFMSSFWHANFYVFILTDIILYLFHLVIDRHWLEPSVWLSSYHI